MVNDLLELGWVFLVTLYTFVTHLLLNKYLLLLVVPNLVIYLSMNRILTNKFKRHGN